MSPGTQKFIKAHIPSWLMTIIVTAALGMLSWAAVKIANHDSRLCVQEDRSDRTAQDVSEIKADIKEIKNILIRKERP